MPETFTKAERSRIMAAVKSRNTKPELLVRRLVHGLGYRFHLHRRDLPGTPDIVLTKFRKIINVHGCFWHMHTCRHARLAPATNADYWQKKRLGNAARDGRTLRLLKRDGWRVLTIWECQTRDIPKLSARIAHFLSQPGGTTNTFGK
jgi:DNA mismatch endonuclease (patch repair protein)